MSTVSKHLDEMRVARGITETKLKALEDLLAIGNHTSEEQQELEENASIARSRLKALDAAITADNELLLTTDYPSPLVFQTSEKVIKGLMKRVDRMEDLIDEFEEEQLIIADAATLQFKAL
jgi:hypothetical protein